MNSPSSSNTNPFGDPVVNSDSGWPRSEQSRHEGHHSTDIFASDLYYQNPQNSYHTSPLDSTPTTAAGLVADFWDQEGSYETPSPISLPNKRTRNLLIGSTLLLILSGGILAYSLQNFSDTVAPPQPLPTSQPTLSTPPSVPSSTPSTTSELDPETVPQRVTADLNNRYGNLPEITNIVQHDSVWTASLGGTSEFQFRYEGDVLYDNLYTLVWNNDHLTEDYSFFYQPGVTIPPEYDLWMVRPQYRTNDLRADMESLDIVYNQTIAPADIVIVTTASEVPDSGFNNLVSTLLNGKESFPEEWHIHLTGIEYRYYMDHPELLDYRPDMIEYLQGIATPSTVTVHTDGTWSWD